MTYEDSDESKLAESSSISREIQPDLEPEIKSQVTVEDLVSFLDQDLDPARTQEVLEQIRENPSLRTEAVAFQSTWDMLDLLPREAPNIGAAEQAAKIIKADASSHWWRSIAARIMAFGMSLILVFSGWYVGRHSPDQSRLELIKSIDQLYLMDMLKVAAEPFFLNKLANDARGSVFEQIRPLNPSDTALAVSEKRRPPADSFGWKKLESEHERFLGLPIETREPLAKMVEMLQEMPEQQQYLLISRLFGLSSWYDNLADQERKNFDQFSGQQRWNKAVNGAEQWLRQKDAIRKQSFTVTNFNRPEYIMDLATVAASWMKLTPQEKLVIERKSRNQRWDTARKPDRVNQLAQALENAPKGTFPAAEFLKNNPPPRLAAKTELLKQQRERKRNEYLEVVRKAGPLTTDPAQLESFVAQLPPWLVDVVDPLPPDEARRLLSILKILVDQNTASETRKNAG